MVTQAKTVKDNGLIYQARRHDCEKIFLRMQRGCQGWKEERRVWIGGYEYEEYNTYRQKNHQKTNESYTIRKIEK